MVYVEGPQQTESTDWGSYSAAGVSLAALGYVAGSYVNRPRAMAAVSDDLEMPLATPDVAHLAGPMAALSVQGMATQRTAKPATRAGAVTMFSEGDLGVLPPLGVYDPLGLIETRDMDRYEIMEIKHGRAGMLGFLHVVFIEAGIRFPTEQCEAAPAGLIASLQSMPTA